jgi:hypothetical protein
MSASCSRELCATTPSAMKLWVSLTVASYTGWAPRKSMPTIRSHLTSSPSDTSIGIVSLLVLGIVEDEKARYSAALAPRRPCTPTSAQNRRMSREPATTTW